MEAELLRELERATHLRVLHPQMLSGTEQGCFLTWLVGTLGARRALEIGTFTGYSALCIAAGLPPDGHLDTIEVNDELETLAGSFFARSMHGQKITQHIGSALEVLPTLTTTYDFIFVDGDKREYPDYYNLLIGSCLVHPGSVIVADNVLWYGKVDDPSHNDLHTRRIREFNDMAARDDRVSSVILPLRDGLNLIRVL